MSSLTASSSSTPAYRTVGPWLPLALVLLSVVSYGLFLVVPYYGNHLDRFPLHEVAVGHHDPKDLWPFNAGRVQGLLWTLGRLFALLIAPVVAFAGTVWAGCRLWDERHDASREHHARQVLHAVAVTCALMLLGWLTTPFGSALLAWMRD